MGNLLEKETYPDARTITVKLMGFLENDTIDFMNKLWQHLIDANNNKLGIPTKLLADAKKRSKMKKEEKMQSAQRYKLKQEIEQKGHTQHQQQAPYRQTYQHNARQNNRQSARGRGREMDR